jgi:hypothetical protein
MRPENIPQLALYPTVCAFVQQHHGMQFADVRAMLRLPTGTGDSRIDTGCNFAAGSTLCNLISGISVVFFNRRGRAPGRRKPARDRGRRFTALLMGYYPWQSGENRATKTEALYKFARNPIVHALGVLQPGDIPFSFNKFAEGQTQAEVDALDVAYDAGKALPPALELVSGRWDLHIPHFYAATVELFRALVADPQQMQQTETCFARGDLID